MISRRCLVALCFFPLLAAGAADNPADAQKKLRAAIDEALAIADRAPDRPTLVERLRPVLERNISFAAMTRRAIGPGWRQFSADQQKKATALFTTLVVRSYSNKFTIGEHPVVDFKPATNPAPGRVDVPTNTMYQGSRYSVIYRMEKEEGWKVTDVVIEGVSMVANYRTQLDDKFKRGGADAVISSLNESASRPK